MASEQTSTKVSQKLLQWWGAFFRFIFIAALALIGFALFYQPGIEDVPLGKLTLKQLGGRTLAAVILELPRFGGQFVVLVS